MTRQELFDWIKNEYGAEPDYPWVKYPQYAVFRNLDSKWFAIVMDVPKNKFGIDSTELVDVLNVKANTLLIDMLVEQPGYYRAYHMNKNQWISIFLDGTVSDDEIKDLINESYGLTGKKHKKITYTIKNNVIHFIG